MKEKPNTWETPDTSFHEQMVMHMKNKAEAVASLEKQLAHALDDRDELEQKIDKLLADNSRGASAAAKVHQDLLDAQDENLELRKELFRLKSKKVFSLFPWRRPKKRIQSAGDNPLL